MIELIVGFGLGAMALTETGREIGNKLGETAIDLAKRGIDRAKSSEQSTGATGDDNHCG